MVENNSIFQFTVHNGKILQVQSTKCPKCLKSWTSKYFHNSKTLHKSKNILSSRFQTLQWRESFPNGEKPFEWRETLLMERNLSIGEKPFKLERNLSIGEKPFDWRETFWLERNLSIGPSWSFCVMGIVKSAEHSSLAITAFTTSKRNLFWFIIECPNMQKPVLL